MTYVQFRYALGQRPHRAAGRREGLLQAESDNVSMTEFVDVRRLQRNAMPLHRC